MKLNIHLISHPIVESLSSSIRDKTLVNTAKKHALKYVGLFIIYETVRNWLKIYRLTIMQNILRKEITVIDPKESYVIIFNDLNQLSFFNEIQEIVPNSRLKLIEEKEIGENDNTVSKITKLDSHTKIIIAINQLRSKYILSLLEYLMKNHKTKASQIRLACMTCTTNQLINISNIHSNLDIYTTRIVEN